MLCTKRILSVALLSCAVMIPGYDQDTDVAIAIDRAASNFWLPNVRTVFDTFTYECSDLLTLFSR